MIVLVVVALAVASAMTFIVATMIAVATVEAVAMTLGLAASTAMPPAVVIAMRVTIAIPATTAMAAGKMETAVMTAVSVVAAAAVAMDTTAIRHAMKAAAAGGLTTGTTAAKPLADVCRHAILGSRSLRMDLSLTFGSAVAGLFTSLSFHLGSQLSRLGMRAFNFFRVGCTCSLGNFRLHLFFGSKCRSEENGLCSSTIFQSASAVKLS